jgi:hypothetical protein
VYINIGSILSCLMEDYRSLYCNVIPEFVSVNLLKIMQLLFIRFTMKFKVKP